MQGNLYIFKVLETCTYHTVYYVIHSVCQTLNSYKKGLKYIPNFKVSAARETISALVRFSYEKWKRVCGALFRLVISLVDVLADWYD